MALGHHPTPVLPIGDFWCLYPTEFPWSEHLPTFFLVEYQNNCITSMMCTMHLDNSMWSMLNQDILFRQGRYWQPVKWLSIRTYLLFQPDTYSCNNYPFMLVSNFSNMHHACTHTCTHTQRPLAVKPSSIQNRPLAAKSFTPNFIISSVADVRTGKQTRHTKVSTKHSLNKVWDTKIVLVKPI